MPVIFGRWNLDGQPAENRYMEKVRSTLDPYSPDGGHAYSNGAVTILYHAFHTTRESRLELQPLVTRTGAVLAWDGRLDNRDDLIAQLKEPLSRESADVSIVASAYEQWGTQCLAKLVGDWALSIWNPNDRSLTLAKDPIGPRHLYYTLDKNEVTWSTILDPLLLSMGRSIELNEKYIAGWFSSFPDTHLTPYAGVQSVQPSTFLRIEGRTQTIQKYWNFNPEKRISHRTDAEYEEHFRAVFAESVRRRLRSDAPVLAELSGGMDSSSIVCMADTLMPGASSTATQLDTLSYYDNSEPNWNEQPYFAKVEEKRGRTGCHVDISDDELFQVHSESGFAAAPSHSNRASKARRQFAAYLSLKGHRVVLSGLGGDEVSGGVPSPIPELGDLLATRQFRALTHQLMAWALDKRKPWFHLLYETCQGFLPRALVVNGNTQCPRTWLQSAFVERNLPVLFEHDPRLKLFGPLPSFQENLNALDLLRKQLACESLSPDLLYERRYPFLDRDLLEFIFATPRGQLVRPGQRRSLMRRALAGIVPDEILNRKRKAYASRAPVFAISKQWPALIELAHQMVSASLGIVDRDALWGSIEKAKKGYEIPIVFLARTLAVECWLESLRGASLMIPGQFKFRNQWLGPEEMGNVTNQPVQTPTSPGARNSGTKERSPGTAKCLLS